MYSKEIHIPMCPTEEDLKKMRKELAYNTFEVIDGGKAKSKPAAGDKAESAGKKD